MEIAVESDFYLLNELVFHGDKRTQLYVAITLARIACGWNDDISNWARDTFVLIGGHIDEDEQFRWGAANITRAYLS